MNTTDMIGGVVVHDPFRWLEDDTDPAVIEWQDREDANTVAALVASPHAARAGEAVRSHFEDLMARWAPLHRGDSWFRTVVAPDPARTVVEVSSTANGAGRTMFDPLQHDTDARLLVHTPSPDGRLLHVQFMVGAAVRHLLIDVASGQVARDLGVLTTPTGVAWAGDSTGFYCRWIAMTTAAGGGMRPEPQIWWQPATGDAERQPVVLDDPTAWPVVSADGRWTAVLVNQGAPRPAWLRATGSDAWTRFLPDATAMYKGTFVGDEYWAITDDVSGWCRLVAIPLQGFEDRATWRELLPAREEIKLASITRCGDHAALSIIEDGVMRLVSLDRTGGVIGDVPLPGGGAFGPFSQGHVLSLMTDTVAPDGDGCTFVHSSLDRGVGIYRADLATLSLTELAAPDHVLADRVVEHVRTAGPHGPVPYRMMRGASTPLDGTAPVIVTGYGGFNVPQVPCYLPMAAAWTALGGIWVHAHLRGGGERDTDFWLGGRMHRKQGTFDDLFAVLEDLYARGVAAPDRTGIWGTSNGGLLIGAAVTQRPELVRAAVAQVPILDLMRCCKDPVTYGTVMIDYGNPNDPADAPVMHAYSPYHNVRAGAPYPALLCDAGAEDVATPPWHSRKMVASIGQASTSGRRTLLRVRQGAGHNLMTTEMSIARDTEELTFFCDELLG